MDVTQFYAIVAGGCIALLFIVHTLIRLSWLSNPVLHYCGSIFYILCSSDGIGFWDLGLVPR